MATIKWKTQHPGINFCLLITIPSINYYKTARQNCQVSIAFLFHFRIFTLVISNHESLLDTCRRSLLLPLGAKSSFDLVGITKDLFFFPIIFFNFFFLLIISKYSLWENKCSKISHIFNCYSYWQFTDFKLVYSKKVILGWEGSISEHIIWRMCSRGASEVLLLLMQIQSTGLDHTVSLSLTAINANSVAITSTVLLCKWLNRNSCWKDLGRSLIKLPDQSRADYEIKWGCSGFYLVRSWILPWMETVQPLWLACSTTCLSSFFLT